MDLLEGADERLRLALNTTVVSDTDKIADLLLIVAQEVRDGRIEGEVREQGEVVLAWAIT